MDQPKVSIIIATYNAASTLEACLASVLAQSFHAWELLIADGGSTDGTLELIKRHAQNLAWWQSKPDAGIYDAWNQAIAHAKGEYVTFLGADDAWHTPSVLCKLFDAIDQRAFDIITSRGALLSRNGSLHEFGNPWDYSKVARRMTICHPGALHRRELFQYYGPFDINYQISADYEFLLRLPSSIRSLHVPLHTIDIADGGISRRRRWTMLIERYRIQASCRRIGPVRAAFNFLDKLWRIPVAKVLGIQN
ncbi:glycosyltransferase family 2 protein [Rhodanobacter sp. DHB23]|uniref:glycosyltransferase family 2 protein n=1 Tax=Rhodanobacter sp. DHB23 TaxID=2775923 RepID=UPI00177AB778|nr:glycosyltransferase family 2 protein [Rhodanobacter sp. DHB23]MBD8873125.1 glycosyltransferase [Rhodanobacter sp. DHB23]